jgi:exodeoxyribonuclease V gamma subunit
MPLRVVHGNRSERLLAALLDALPPPDPFEPTTIVVGSHLVARWLVREIAFARGIACGLDLVTFDRFVERTWAGDAAARDAGLRALDVRQLAALLASVLADRAIVEPLAPLADYLDAAGTDADRAAPRRVQLAAHLADLFWRYAETRPSLVAAFAGGRVPDELERDERARWQARLYEAALARMPGVAVPTPMLPWARRRAGLPAPRATTPVFAFGISYLARAELDALGDLASTSDVALYMLDPCRELWDDVARKGEDPLPLALWGRALQGTLAELVERTGGDLEPAFVDVAPTCARERLLVDVLERRTPAQAAAPPIASAGEAGEPAGVVVLACPDVRRELEVVAAEIRARLDADATLRANDIAVLVASDVDRYLAQAPSAFEAVAVPCHVVDAPIDDRGRVAEAALALLALPTSTLARRDLLRVMTHPAVLAGVPHVDAADWVRWTERLGIARGADAHAHAGTYLEDHADRFHWEQGVHRLALGAFMVGDSHDARAARPVRIGVVDVAPEEVRGDEQASAATYALLVRSLCADAAWLATHVAPLATWARAFAELVEAYLAGARVSADRDFERVRSTLAGLARFDLDGRAIGFREARELARRQLASARADRGEPLAAGVAIARLAPMRALPFRAIFVVGLDERAFPASDRPSALDVTSGAPARGDVSPRDRDRCAFLEALLGARDALYLSYVAVEPKSGQAIAPSATVLELADALAPYLGATSSQGALAAIARRAPLHRFTAPADAPDLPPAIARERWAAGARDAIRTHLRGRGIAVPDDDGMLAALSHPSLAALRDELGLAATPTPAGPTLTRTAIPLSSAREFLVSPVQAWAQVVLDLDDLPDDARVERSDEPFHVDRADRAIVLRDVFATQLAAERAGFEPAAATIYDAVVRRLELRGRFPVGVFGEAQRAQDLATLEAWRDALEDWRGGGSDPPATSRFAFGRATSAGAKLVPALDIELSGSRTVRLSGQTEILVPEGRRHVSIVPIAKTFEKRSHYHLRGAFDHVALAAAGLAGFGHAHLLVDGDGRTLFVEHEPWTQRDARRYLADVVGELFDIAHGYLLPFDSLVRALAGARPLAKFGDPTGGLGYGPIARRDGLGPPLDVAAIARRRLAPLVERMRGDTGFEVKS